MKKLRFSFLSKVQIMWHHSIAKRRRVNGGNLHFITSWMNQFNFVSTEVITWSCIIHLFHFVPILQFFKHYCVFYVKAQVFVEIVFVGSIIALSVHWESFRSFDSFLKHPCFLHFLRFYFIEYGNPWDFLLRHDWGFGSRFGTGVWTMVFHLLHFKVQVTIV